MVNWTLQTLPEYRSITSLSQRIDSEQLSELVYITVQQVAVLEQTIKSQSQKEIVAQALFKQKELFETLKKAAGKGYAHAGLGVMQAIIITGQHLNQLFDYASPYDDKRGYTEMARFIKLPNLISVMQQWNTLQKAESLTGFATRLPDLRNMMFSTDVFDALNNPSITTEKSFNQEIFPSILTEALLKTDNPIERREQRRAHIALQIAAEKQYPGALLAYGSLLKTLGDESGAKRVLDQMTLNKFATDETKRIARHLAIPHSEKARKILSIHSTGNTLS